MNNKLVSKHKSHLNQRGGPSSSDEESDTSSDDTSKSSSDANETSNDTDSAKENTSVASVYPYYRAVHEKKESKNDKEEKKPYEPRPLKYKENYEDKGIKVFEPDFEVIGTVTTDNYEVIGKPKSFAKGKPSNSTSSANSTSSTEKKSSKNSTAAK